MDRRVHAWADESVHVSESSPGFYVLAATICHRSAVLAIREVMYSLTLPGQKRLHWREESPKRRDHIVASIHNMGLTHLAVHAPAVAAKQERARRKCLERLLFELDQRDVIGLWLETRQAVLNRRDQETVEAARGSRIITRKLNVKHAQPVDEPMLWLPDAVAGMTTAALRDNNVGWLDTLGAACLTIQL